MPETVSQCPFCATAIPAGAVVCRGCGAQYGYSVGNYVRTSLDGIEGLYSDSQSVAKVARWIGLIIILVSACNMATARQHAADWGIGIVFGAFFLLIWWWTRSTKSRQLDKLRRQGPQWYR